MTDASIAKIGVDALRVRDDARSRGPARAFADVEDGDRAKATALRHFDAIGSHGVPKAAQRLILEAVYGDELVERLTTLRRRLAARPEPKARGRADARPDLLKAYASRYAPPADAYEFAVLLRCAADLAERTPTASATLLRDLMDDADGFSPETTAYAIAQVRRVGGRDDRSVAAQGLLRPVARAVASEIGAAAAVGSLIEGGQSAAIALRRVERILGEGVASDAGRAFLLDVRERLEPKLGRARRMLALDGMIA